MCTLGPRCFVDARGAPLATARRERSTERPLYYSAFISLFTIARRLVLLVGRRPLYYTACISLFTTARRVVLAGRR